MSRQKRTVVTAKTTDNERDRREKMLRECIAARDTYPEGKRERKQIELQIERLKNDCKA